MAGLWEELEEEGNPKSYNNLDVRILSGRMLLGVTIID